MNRRTGRAMSARERELIKRCLVLMAGSVFFFIMAALRASGGEYGYGPDRDRWAPFDEDEYDVMSEDDHVFAWRLSRQVVGNRPVYNRRKASRVHDSVTIIIDEDTESEIASSNDLKSDRSHNLSINSWLTPSLSGGLGTTQHGAAAGGRTPTIDYSSTRAHKSDSTIERSQYLQSTLTGKVIDVQPNGYLVIEARKTVNINGEEQLIVLTGIVNPVHMDSSSTIRADMIIDMYVKYSGSGPMTRQDKRGWGSKIVDFLTPF